MKISIITPNYNGSKYLEATILSVLGQKYPNLESKELDETKNTISKDVDEKEYYNLYKSNHPYLFHHNSPWKNEYCLNIKHQEENSKQIIAYIELEPCNTFGRYTAFIRFKLLRIKRFWSYNSGECRYNTHKKNSEDEK